MTKAIMEVAQMFLGIHDQKWPPIGLFALVFFAVHGLLGNRERLGKTVTALHHGRGFPWPEVSTVLLSTFLASGALCYLFSPFFFDHVEPQVASVSWLFVRGEPVYHSLDSGARYSLLYGPLLYMLPGTVMAALGPGIHTVKVLFTACALLLPILLWLSTGRVGATSRKRVVTTGLAVLACLLFGYHVYWVRSEPLILALVAGALAAASGRSRGRAAALCAIIFAASLHLKVSTPLYLLPALAMLFQTHGKKAGLAAIMGAAALSMTPYLLPMVSLKNHWEWIKVAESIAWTDRFLPLSMLQWLLYLSVPPIAFLASSNDRRSLMRRQWPFLLANALAAAGAFRISIVKGAHYYHLYPLVPSFALLTLVTAREGVSPAKLRFLISAMIAFVVATTARAWVDQRSSWSMYGALAGVNGAHADIEAYLDRNPGRKVAVGYGELYHLSVYRMIPVFRGHPFLFDSAAIGNMEYAGMKFPETTYELVSNCAVDTWLIPRVPTPFMTGNMLNSDSRLFDDRFRELFLSRYASVENTVFYGVWRCRGG